MKKFIAVLRRDKQVVQTSIYTDDDLDLTNVISFYEKKENHKVGEVNRFGATLVEIKEVEYKDKILIERFDSY